MSDGSLIPISFHLQSHSNDSVFLFSQLLEHVYPALLTTEQTPQQVEIFVPLGVEWIQGEEEKEEEEEETGGIDVPPPPTDASPSMDSASAPRQGSSPHFQLNGSLSHHQVRRNTSVLSTQSVPGSIVVGSPASSSEQQSGHSSWEVISKQSTTSNNRLSVITDVSSRHSVVPLWECIQEAFKSPVIHINGSKLLLPRVIPDVLFADLPSELIFWSKVGEREQEELSLPPSKETSGLFIRRYYTSEQEDVCVRKPAGALRAVSDLTCTLVYRLCGQ